MSEADWGYLDFTIFLLPIYDACRKSIYDVRRMFKFLEPYPSHGQPTKQRELRPSSN